MQIYGQGTEGRAFSALIGDGTGGTTTTLQKIAFVPDVRGLSVELITTQGVGLTGTWLIEVSNNYAPDPGYMGQPANVGNWVNDTANWLPAITSPIAGTTAQALQRADFMWRAARVTFTRTAGTGQAEIWIQGKGA